MPIASAGRQAIEIQRNGVGWAGRVAARIQHPAGEMIGVQVNSKYSMLAKLLQRWPRTAGGAVASGTTILNAVVGKSYRNPPGGSLSRPFLVAVGEAHRTGPAGTDWAGWQSASGFGNFTHTTLSVMNRIVSFPHPWASPSAVKKDPGLPAARHPSREFKSSRSRCAAAVYPSATTEIAPACSQPCSTSANSACRYCIRRCFSNLSP